jgi:hypothetical protein
MAEPTKEQIEQEQKRLDLLQKQNEAVNNLTAAYNALGKIKGKLSDTDKEAINLAKILTNTSKEIEKSISRRLTGTISSKELEKQLKQLKQDQIYLLNKEQKITDRINADKTAALAAFRKAAIDERKIKKDLQDIDEDIANQEIIKQIAIQNGNASLAKQASDEIKALQYNAKLKEKNLDSIVKQKEAQKELFKALNKEKEAHEQIKKQLDEEIAKTKEALKLKEREEAINVLKKQFRLEEIKDMFTLAGLFKIILDAGLRFQSTSTEIGKNLGYGREQANRMTDDLVMMAETSINLNVTLQNLGEAMSQLNTATGGVAEYSADTLQTQIMLTKQFGLSGDEAAGLYKFSVLTGKASSQINDEMVGTFVATRNAVKGSANFKETMATVAKISGQLAVNFQNNPALLTKAVVQAQVLGTTLEKTKSQGEALLNFESSIEDELKAELLTGQQMNLERARAAALQGDQVTVMKELANQGMTLNKFQNMNVIAQQSYAKALGLTADELSDQLRKQKIAQEQGKSLVEITKQEALEAEQRQKIQDKFNAAIEKLQDFIGNLVAGPVGKLLELFTDMLPAITAIAAVYGTIALVSKSMMLYEEAKRGAALGYNGILLARQAIMGGELAKAVGIAAAWAIANPIQALVGLGVAAAAGALIYSLVKPVGDLALSPGDGPIVSTAENGIFQGTKNDEVAMFPGAVNMAKGGRGEGGMTTPNMDLTPLIAAINATTSAINRGNAKDTTVAIDSKKVNNSAMQNSTKAA